RREYFHKRACSNITKTNFQQNKFVDLSGCTESALGPRSQELMRLNAEQDMQRCVQHLDKAIYLNGQTQAIVDFAYYETSLGQMDYKLGTFTPLWQILSSLPVIELKWHPTKRNMIISCHSLGCTFVGKHRGLVMCSSIVSGHKPVGFYLFHSIITCVDICDNDSTLIAVGFDNGRVNIFNSNASSLDKPDCNLIKPASFHYRHSGKVYSIKFRKLNASFAINSSNFTLMSCGSDGIVGQWRMNNGLCFEPIFKLNDIIYDTPADIQLQPENSGTCMNLNNFDSSLFLIGTNCGYVSAISLRSFNDPVFVAQAHVGPVRQVSWCPLHKYVFLTAGHDQHIKIWDLHRRCLVIELQIEWSLTYIEWSPFLATRFFGASLENTIYVFDLSVELDRAICKFSTAQIQDISTLSLHQSSSIIAVGDRKGSICIYKLSENIGKPKSKSKDDAEVDDDQILFEEAVRFDELLSTLTGIEQDQSSQSSWMQNQTSTILDDMSMKQSTM
ncbi:hypothetical protein GJ496_010008, partial [Pomphorhynchus laevis]